jgi:hypothetical protein
MNETEWVEDAILWLEEDHFCRQTGFMKQRIHRRLRQHELTTAQANRVRDLIIDVVMRGPRQELKEICRTARYVDSEALRDMLREVQRGADPFGLGNPRPQPTASEERWPLDLSVADRHRVSRRVTTR